MDKILGLFIDKFKVSNPRTFAFLAVVLLIVKYAVEQGSGFGLFEVTPTIASIADWITYAIALLMGSRTYNAINGTAEE